MALISLAAMLACVAATGGARATIRTASKVSIPEQLRVALGLTLRVDQLPRQIESKQFDVVAGLLVIIGYVGRLGQRVLREILVLPDHPDERGLVPLHRGDAGKQVRNGGFGRGEERLEMVERGLGCEGVVVVLDLGTERQLGLLVGSANRIVFRLAEVQFAPERQEFVMKFLSLLPVHLRTVHVIFKRRLGHHTDSLEFIVFQSQIDLGLFEFLAEAKVVRAKLFDLVLHNIAVTKNPVNFKIDRVYFKIDCKTADLNRFFGVRTGAPPVILILSRDLIFNGIIFF